MNELKLWNFEDENVRIVDKDNNPWFVGKDVCDILGYVNSRKAISDHCREKGVTICDILSNGGVQKTTIINEPNLYRLITHSKLPRAEKFEAWVFEELLPTIRKTGSYNTNIINREILDLKNRMNTIEKRLENSIQQDEINLDVYMTVRGYCQENNYELVPGMRVKLGQECSSYCRERNIHINRSKTEWGYKNVYPYDVIDIVYKRLFIH